MIADISELVQELEWYRNQTIPEMQPEYVDQIIALLKAQEHCEDAVSRQRLKDEIQYYIDEAGWGDEINKALAEQIGRGVTLIPAKGGYTGREKDLLAVVIRRNEFSQTLGIIKSIDPASFTFAMSATEVHGEGFKQE